MKHLVRFFLSLLLILSPGYFAYAASCDAFNEHCSSYCKTTMCNDACGRGQSYCKVDGCKAGNHQCEQQCAELDAWNAQENCYNACWKGAKAC